MRADPPAGEKDAAESREERTDRECQAHAMLVPRVPGERHHRSALVGGRRGKDDRVAAARSRDWTTEARGKRLSLLLTASSHDR